MIERKIVIALITNTEYLRAIESIWRSEFIESSTAKLISTWCWEFYNKYGKAPMYDIDTIFMKKLRAGKISSEDAEEIETEILPNLSQEYEKENLDIKPFVQETKEYFIERQITIHQETIEALLVKGKVEEAKKEIEDFRLIEIEEDDHIVDLSEPESLDRIENAFKTAGENLIEFPGALGEFWNEELYRGAFVSLMGPEKRGKTFWMLELMIKAYEQGRKVVFFQAGDMTEEEQLLRISIYLAKKSNKEKYCNPMYIPVADCIKNQADTCNRKIRECDFGLFNMDEEEIREKITLKDLIEAKKEEPKYKACHNCLQWQRSAWGTPWIKKIGKRKPLTIKEAKRISRKFFIESGRRIKISTHANTTLNVRQIESELDELEVKEGFVADVIIVDYADLLEPEIKGDFRHQDDHKWKRLRKLSQERKALVITATQTDSSSYEQDTITLKNFSENKRKFAHVTAMYGLNQDKNGREKELGVMRLNRIVLRGGDFHSNQQVRVLRKLEIGRPLLDSFY